MIAFVKDVKLKTSTF